MKAYAFCLLLLAMPVGATVYDFHGTCTTVCEGQVYAEFLLADSYVPGAQVDCGWPIVCQLQRLRYIDSTTIEDYDFRAGSAAGLFLEPLGFIHFPAVSGPGFAGFGIMGGTKDDFPFRAGLDGSWQMWTRAGFDTHRLAGGTNGSFELAAHEFIPEPGTWLLLGAGLLALPYRRRIASRTVVHGWRSAYQKRTMRPVMLER